MSTESISIDAARQRIEELVERFSANIDSYKSQGYNETQTRNEFINPFFEALGWDIYNRSGYAEAYKDVIHEDAIKIGGLTKAPDYCFRIGGQRKFFVEAKKPFVNLGSDTAPYFQLRRYAYSAKLPLSILTDFEELAVLDCRSKPSQNDKASAGRIAYYSFEEYPKKMEEIFATFSKEAVLKGSFDRYVSSSKAKRGTGEVDKEFLKEIEGWRDLLARNIALRNPGLSQRDLNYVVQATIDRLIFLRICEDRGIEEYGVLQGLQNGSNVYPRLCQLFQRADERYNSGLFHFSEERGRGSADELSLSLVIDDKPLKDILRCLYYPESPYEFSVLPVDILGQVYEQFLGKVIRLTVGHQAKIEDKPEVKKAGGIYYTPTYIVDYIVKNTVGKQLEGKTPKQAEKLRILDPSCGSGSFLIGAYEYLMDWHRDWYTENEPEKWAVGKNPRIFQGNAGWQLTTPEKKRILLNNIYGVDIDSQAVEVTKLSLLLKVLEEENAETIGKNLTLFHERALPDLSKNVKCGNSLIGSDFYEGQQLGLLNDEERYRINPFDWEDEFVEIMSAGGFDAVIGNPPWGAEIHMEERRYLTDKYPFVADYESSQFFIFKSLSLLGNDGSMSMIIPNTFVLNVYARNARTNALEAAGVTEILDISDTKVFLGPSVRSTVISFAKSYKKECFLSQWIEINESIIRLRTVSQEQLANSETWKTFFSVETDLTKILDRLVKETDVLADYCDVRQGYIPYRTTTLTRRLGAAKAHEVVKKRIWHSNKKEGPDYLMELQGRDVGRYCLLWSGVWVKYGEWVSTYLPIEVFSGSRILIREITGKPPHRLLATYSEELLVHNPSVLAVLPKPDSISPFFILGVVNSILMSTMFSYLAPKAKKGLFPKIIITDAKRLPFPRVEMTNRVDKSNHDKIVELVESMMDLNKRLQAAKTAHEKDTLQRQIDATDRRIDRFVYELYDLTADEIKIVEGSK